VIRKLMLFTALFFSLSVTLAMGADEPPILADAVKAGTLPPMAERLPKVPEIVDFDEAGKDLGRYGGTLHLLMASEKDIRMMTVYGYARLVGFDENFDLKPDILEAFDVEENRIYTLHIRPGQKWSDGEPFTAEDFRYWWEDVANNKGLSGGGVPQFMLTNDKPPAFEIVDDLTVRYTWDAPNPVFPLALAGAAPEYIFMPAHYMKQFNEKYADPEQLAAKVKEENVRDWTALHTRMGRQYRPENPDLPTLEPWRNTTPGPTKRYVFERNPYFHRVDPEGRQLPYIDKVIIDVASNEIIPAKTGAGDSDLQARYLRFENYTFLKEAEKSKDFTVHLWKNGVSSQIALYPNLNVADPGWKTLMQDVRFRRALSMGIDREELNQQLYFGLAQPSSNTVISLSPLYSETVANAWTQFDPDKANQLLDEIGLDKRDTDSTRLLPDGRRAEIIVETTGESTEETDALELIRYQWEQIGIKLFPRPLQRDIVRHRYLTGETQMLIFVGLNVGLANADMNPEELAPVSSLQPNWPVWGQYTETGGKAGSAPDIEAAADLLKLYEKWRVSTDREEKRDIWKEMLRIYSDQVFSIGICGETVQPVVVNNELKNIPDEGIYSWAPTAYFGVYKPDTFWFEK
jgi:peptide/nickel transport system substrate-binding protein